MNFTRLVLLSIVLWIVGTSVVFAETIKTKDYWVLTDKYDVGFSGGKRLTVTYESSNKVYNVNFMDTGIQKEFYDEGGSLLYSGLEWTEGGYFTVSPPRVLFPATIEIDKDYSADWDRREYDIGGWYHGWGSDEVDFRVTGPEAVTLSYGFSIEAYKFTLVDTWSDSWGQRGVSTAEYWVAKDVGWVKVMRNDVTYELQPGPPQPPTLTVSTSGTTVSLSWTKPLAASGYTLFYAPYPSQRPIGSMDMETQTGVSVVLSRDAAFYVAVQARNSYGSSRYSNIGYFILNE